MSKNYINIILFIIGTILILISFYFISFSIPSLDNSIESIDSNISKLDGKISEIQRVIEENREIKNMIRNEENTIEILKNLPPSDKIQSSYSVVLNKKINHYSIIIYSLLSVNDENIEYIIQGKYDNNLLGFREYINITGHDEADKLYLEQIEKAIDRSNTFNTEKNQLHDQKAELIEKRKKNLKQASFFQLFGLVLIFFGAIFDKFEKNKKV